MKKEQKGRRYKDQNDKRDNKLLQLHQAKVDRSMPKPRQNSTKIQTHVKLFMCNWRFYSALRPRASQEIWCLDGTCGSKLLCPDSGRTSKTACTRCQSTTQPNYEGQNYLNRRYDLYRSCCWSPQVLKVLREMWIWTRTSGIQNALWQPSLTNNLISRFVSIHSLQATSGLEASKH